MQNLRCLLLFFCSIISISISAQSTYQTSITNVNLNSVVETLEGDYIGGGWNFGEYDIDLGYSINQGMVLVKTNNIGDTLWSRIYSLFGIGHYGEIHAIEITSDGGYLIGGWCPNCPVEDPNLILIRTDGNGDTLWTRQIGGDNWERVRSIRNTIDGGFIIAGETASFGDSNIGMFITKINDYGDLLWSKKLILQETAGARSILQNQDGSFVIVGTANLGSEDSDILMVCLNPEGELLWTKSFGGTGIEYGFGVCLTNENGYALIGETTSIESGSGEVCLIVTDSLGNYLWTKIYGSLKGDYGTCIFKTNDGGYIIGGRSNSFESPLANSYVLRTDGAGNLLWSKTFGFGSTIIFDIIETSDGGYLSAGVDYEFVKMNADGPSSCGGSSVNTNQREIAIGIKNIPVTIMDVNPIVGNPYLKILQGLEGVNKCIPTKTKDITSKENWMELKSNIIFDEIEFTFSERIPGTISIIDVTGKVITKTLLNNNDSSYTIDASNLIPGIYFLAAQMKEGIITKKFLKL